MKNLSQRELYTAVYLVVVLFILGIDALNVILTTLKIIGVNLYEILLAKHFTWFVVRGILVLFSSAGIWLGLTISKVLFSGVLFWIVTLFF